MNQTQSLPTTVKEILAVAESVFADPAAVSCVIQASWGAVEVTRGTPHQMKAI